jgi:hypothetical protein
MTPAPPNAIGLSYPPKRAQKSDENHRQSPITKKESDKSSPPEPFQQGSEILPGD